MRRSFSGPTPRTDGFGKGSSFGNFGVPGRPKPAESRRRGADPSQRGGAVFRTVLQEYDSRSDYKRWRAGLDLAVGNAAGGRYTSSYEVQPLRDFAPWAQHNRYELTAFAAGSAGRTTWQVVRMMRGSWVLPQVLQASDIALRRTGGDVSRDRIILSVGATLSSGQLEQWKTLVGLQFENSAIPVGGGYGLLDQPEDAIAYTLVAVDTENGALWFDLSRPYRRIRPTLESPRKFWSLRSYDRQKPVLWNTGEERVLVSSEAWGCDCPDHSGLLTAVLDQPSGAPQSARFPLPSAQSAPLNRWEVAVAGYRTRFRQLDERADRRRACKHIHADRWRAKLPFYEPADYPFMDVERQFQSAQPAAKENGFFRVNARRDLELDSAIVAIAEASGVSVDTRNLDTGEDAAMPADRPPILWTSTREPSAALARIDDWWLKRGTREARVWDPADGGSWSSGQGALRLVNS